MKDLFTICVYGDFKKNDIRMKVFKSGDMEQYSFQNTLIRAGYDANLFSVNDTEVPFLQEKAE